MYAHTVARALTDLDQIFSGVGPEAWLDCENEGNLRVACYGLIPTASNAHSIRTDNTNRFVFVPRLGTDQVFQFLFDEKSGRLTANTPPVLQLKQGSGLSSPDRFV